MYTAMGAIALTAVAANKTPIHQPRKVLLVGVLERFRSELNTQATTPVHYGRSRVTDDVVGRCDVPRCSCNGLDRQGDRKRTTAGRDGLRPAGGERVGHDPADEGHPSPRTVRAGLGQTTNSSIWPPLTREGIVGRFGGAALSR